MITLALAVVAFVVSEYACNLITAGTSDLIRAGVISGAVNGAAGVLMWVAGSPFGWPAGALYAVQIVCLIGICWGLKRGRKDTGSLHRGDRTAG